MLMQHFLNADRAILQSIIITISVTAIVLGQGLIGQNHWVLLIPLPVIFVTYHYITDKRFHIWTIGSYISTCLEKGDLGLNYETRIRIFREKCLDRKLIFIPGSTPILSEFSLTHILMLTIITLFALKIDNLNFWLYRHHALDLSLSALLRAMDDK